MSDILYDLYFGKITPWEKKVTDPFVKEAVEKTQKARKKLEEQLPEQLKPLLEAFCLAESDMHGRALYAEYLDGFKTGIRLMSAVFERGQAELEYRPLTMSELACKGIRILNLIKCFWNRRLPIRKKG